MLWFTLKIMLCIVPYIFKLFCFYSARDIICELLRQSPNFPPIHHNNITVNMVVIPWVDYCLPIVMLRAKLFDPARVFFPDAFSETFDLREMDIDNMGRYIINVAVGSQHICVKINIWYANVL